MRQRSKMPVWFGFLSVLLITGCPDSPQPTEPPAPEVDPDTMRGTGQLGDACEATVDCALPMRCDRDSERGYCRVPVCEVGCEGLGGVCASVAGQPDLCWATCDGTRDAEPGAKCIQSDAAPEGLLAPATQQESFVPFEDITQALGVVCESTPGPATEIGPSRDFAFEIAPGDSAFMVVNTTASDELFFPHELLLPGDESVDLVFDYRHHNARLGDMEQERAAKGGRYGQVSMDWSILFPYTQSRADLVEPGTYTMRVVSAEQDLCFYMLQNKGSTRLDLNFYFTNYGEFNAVHASDDEDFQDVLERVDEIYGQAGIEIGKTRYFNVPPEGRAFTVIRDLADLRALAAFGSSPEPGLDGALSVDVFLVDTIAVPEGQILGVSGGIPGPPGLHGNWSNGLVFSLDNLGINNKLVAHVMAHEIGHYLGLRHTSEFVIGTDFEEDFETFVGARDPHEDTASCDEIMTLGWDCPDGGNLMFPAVPTTHQSRAIELSEDQSALLRANPLTK